MRWLLKRWWFWGGTAFMLVAVATGYLVIRVEESRISQANCDRIQPAMTMDEVVPLLGNNCLPHARSITGPMVVTWFDDDGNIITVTFKSPWRDEVTERKFRPTELPFRVRLKRRIERRIHAVWP